MSSKIWNAVSSNNKIDVLCITVSGLRRPLVVSCCKFLKFVISKTFNKIVLALLSVESKTNILYVNINYTGNLLLGFGRYCGKVLLEPLFFTFLDTFL